MFVPLRRPEAWNFSPCLVCVCSAGGGVTVFMTQVNGIQPLLEYESVLLISVPFEHSVRTASYSVGLKPPQNKSWHGRNHHGMFKRN